MGSALGDRAALIWSLAGSGLGTTISANGNSGAYAANTDYAYRTPVDLRWTDDLTITAYVAGAVTGTTPSLTVQLGFYDDQGNLFQPSTLKLTAITAQSNATTAQFLAVGRHAGSAGTYIALPEWGQIAWTVTGTTPVFNQVEIAVYAR
jgi:hypothetical protein